MGLHDRVELQSEVRAPRELVFGLLSTAEGLARWLDSADLEPRVGGAIRIQMRDAVATGTVLSLQP
ncbi:MAG TPA: SRPBCC domain-containing protein, partial [Candidatus Limnocylindrales bacterium]|nr:SRPBCC domain-containing protein [Candidatus Limnocylindrales bacterium]